MTQVAKKKTSMTKRIVSIVLFVLSAVLIITSIAGFVIRGMDSTAAKLNEKLAPNWHGQVFANWLFTPDQFVL